MLTPWWWCWSRRASCGCVKRVVVGGCELWIGDELLGMVRQGYAHTPLIPRSHPAQGYSCLKIWMDSDIPLNKIGFLRTPKNCHRVFCTPLRNTIDSFHCYFQSIDTKLILKHCAGSAASNKHVEPFRIRFVPIIMKLWPFNTHKTYKMYGNR